MSITFTTVLINVQVIKMFVSRGYGWPSTSDKTVALTFIHGVIREKKKLKFLLMRARAKKEITQQQSRRRTRVQRTNERLFPKKEKTAVSARHFNIRQTADYKSRYQIFVIALPTASFMPQFIA